MTTTTAPLTSRQIALDPSPESFGELRRSDDIINDPAALRARFAEDAYLYIPGFFPRANVAAARGEFISFLENEGALHPDHAPDEAMPSGAPLGNYAPIIRDQKKSPAVRNIIFGSRILGFYKSVFGEDVAHFDHIWVRIVSPGEGTPPHADSVYMNRGSKKLMTSWIPYGDVSRKLGGLMLLENSHLQADRLRHYLDSDVDTFCENHGPYKIKSGWLSNNPASLRENLGGRWLTANFQMGDLLTFGLETVHGSLDNHDVDDFLYVQLCTLVPEAMIELFRQHRVMVTREATIFLRKLKPPSNITVDALLFPWKKLARRIATDLGKSKGAMISRSAVLEAEWRPQIPLAEVLQTVFNE